MTISEKIERLKEIPKSIAEKEEDRKRLASLTSTRFDKVGDSVSKSNSAENKDISYADKGISVDLLNKERDMLIRDIQSEIYRKITGTDVNSIDMRRILKSYYLDNHNLKYISNKIIFRSYSTTKELFQKARKELKIDCSVKMKDVPKNQQL